LAADAYSILVRRDDIEWGSEVAGLLLTAAHVASKGEVRLAEVERERDEARSKISYCRSKLAASKEWARTIKRERDALKAELEHEKLEHADTVDIATKCMRERYALRSKLAQTEEREKRLREAALKVEAFWRLDGIHDEECASNNTTDGSISDEACDCGWPDLRSAFSQPETDEGDAE
jgi:septal ring factor EnvC (AmiA/AmiB activator)